MTNVPYSANPGEPTLADVLQLHKKEILLGMSSHHLATVQSFNSAKQTASATINYKKTFFVRGPTGQYIPELVDYPQLTDCPVLVMGGGLGAVTFPVARGDECLVCFNDRDMDNWFQGNSSTSPNTGRLHSFSDGVILVGLRSLANVLLNYDSVRACLRSKAGETVVGVNPSTHKVLITNTAPSNTTTLNTLLAQLITQIQALCTLTAAITVSGVLAGGGTSGPPTNAAAITAVITQLTTINTAIGVLLE